MPNGISLVWIELRFATGAYDRAVVVAYRRFGGLRPSALHVKLAASSILPLPL